MTFPTVPLERLIFLKNIECDIIISDQEMPEMKGLELLKQLRKKGYKGKTALLSAHELSDEEIKVYLNDGVDFVLRKPIRRQDLLNIFKY
jgi:CheY-like chemotaxis protein